jgi:hypothetical protein
VQLSRWERAGQESRDIVSARTSFTAALTVHGSPADLVPAALHNTDQYENNRVECGHGRLKTRLRSMRGLKTHRTASVVIRGHAFIQNLRRGRYELALDTARPLRLATAFEELRPAICPAQEPVPPQHCLRSKTQQILGRSTARARPAPSRLGTPPS